MSSNLCNYLVTGMETAKTANYGHAWLQAKVCECGHWLWCGLYAYA